MSERPNPVHPQLKLVRVSVTVRYRKRGRQTKNAVLFAWSPISFGYCRFVTPASAAAFKVYFKASDG
jgi:hypothetical protein